ncbi:hypothetical protein HAX54_046863, partial [Datura stramonium]|nr:hypothetical protein [Datura stramonium]
MSFSLASEGRQVIDIIPPGPELLISEGESIKFIERILQDNGFPRVFEEVVRIPYDMQLKQVLANDVRGRVVSWSSAGIRPWKQEVLVREIERQGGTAPNQGSGYV